MRGTAADPAGVMPACELVHHCDSSSIWPPLRSTLARIQTSGMTAMKNAAHITRRAMRSFAARDDDLDASSGRRGGAGGRRRGGVELHGAHSVKAFLRSMTMRAMALTAKVSTKSTRPAAM